MATPHDLHFAVKSLAERCDFAQQKDDQGFNAKDTHIGHLLASTPVELWTQDVIAFVSNQLLPTYRKQLERMGINVREVAGRSDYTQDEVKTAVKRGMRKDTHTVTWDHASQRFFVKSPYDKTLVEQYRVIKPRGQFNRFGKNEWSYDLYAAEDVEAFALRNEFHISDEAKKKIQEGKTLPPKEVLPDWQIIEDASFFRVFFPPESSILTRIKAIRGASFDFSAERKHWKVPKNEMTLFDLRDFVRHYEHYTNYIGLIDNACATIKAGKDSVERLSKSVSAKVDLDTSRLKLDLRPYQKIGVKFLLDNKKVLLADDMGVGKTPISITTLGCDPSTLPALVICPASLKLNWAKEAASWLDTSVTVICDKKPEYRLRLIQGVHTTVKTNRWDADVVVINYDILEKHFDKLAALPYNTLIVDESHMIKNPKAKRTKIVQALSNRAKYRYCLSGTPILNRAIELLPQLEVLDRVRDVGGKRAFLTRYCNPQHNGWGWTYDGASNLDELHTILRRSGTYIRRTKEQVLKELPPKQRVTVPLEMSPSLAKKYAKAEKEYIDYVLRHAQVKKEFLKAIAHLPKEQQDLKIAEWRAEKARRAERAEHLTKLQSLKHLCAQGKLDAFKEWVEDFMATGEKLVVFAHHTDVIEDLTSSFSTYGAVSITGSTPTNLRQEYVDRFQTSEFCRVIVCNLQAGGVGITLTAASNVATLEYGWTAGLHTQAEDRAYRFGQDKSVTAWYFVANDSIDDYMIGIIESKRAATDALIDGTTDKPTAGLIGDLSKWIVLRSTQQHDAEITDDLFES